MQLEAGHHPTLSRRCEPCDTTGARFTNLGVADIPEGTVTKIVDVRQGYDPNKAAHLRGHIGSHPEVLSALLSGKTFRGLAQKCLEWIKSLNPDTQNVLLLKCTSAPHRTASMATLLYFGAQALGLTTAATLSRCA